MKIYFNKDFQITKYDLEDTYQGTANYTRMNVFIPVELSSSYEVITCDYSGKLPDGRTYGAFQLEYVETTQDGYLNYATVTANGIAEVFFTQKGTVTFSISFRLNVHATDTAAITKTCATVRYPVYDAIVLDNKHIDLTKLDNAFMKVTNDLEETNAALESKVNKSDLAYEVVTNTVFADTINGKTADDAYIQFLKDSQGNSYVNIETSGITPKVTFNGYDAATEEYVQEYAYSKEAADNRFVNPTQSTTFYDSVYFSDSGTTIFYNQPIFYNGATFNGTATFTGTQPTFNGSKMLTEANVTGKAEKTYVDSTFTTKTELAEYKSQIEAQYEKASSINAKINDKANDTEFKALKQAFEEFMAQGDGLETLLEKQENFAKLQAQFDKFFDGVGQDGDVLDTLDEIEEALDGKVDGSMVELGESQDLPSLELGTKVEVNPTIPDGITPIEANSLKVGDQYYAMGGGGKLYNHNMNICFTNGSNYQSYINASVITQSPTKFNYATLYDYINKVGRISATGAYAGASWSTSGIIIGLSNWSGVAITCEVVKFANSSVFGGSLTMEYRSQNVPAYWEIKDTVTDMDGNNVT